MGTPSNAGFTLHASMSCMCLISLLSCMCSSCNIVHGTCSSEVNFTRALALKVVEMQGTLLYAMSLSKRTMEPPHQALRQLHQVAGRNERGGHRQ